MARIAGVSASDAGPRVRLAYHFTRRQIARLAGRFNLALGVGAAGFSEGMVCAVPATAPQSAPGSAATS